MSMSSTHLVDREEVERALVELEKHDLEAANLLRNYIRGLESRTASDIFVRMIPGCSNDAELIEPADFIEKRADF